MEGHRAVGRLAEHHLSSHARREVAALLGTETLTMVSTWPDETLYSTSPEFKQTGPWHYINIEMGLDYAHFTQALTAQTGPNVYTQLLAQLTILKDKTKPKAERATALKYVVHFVGDIHQPLHVSRAADKGGNGIKITYRGKDTNLHTLWDSGLLDYQGLSYTEIGTAYDYLPASQIRTWQHDEPLKWAFESAQLSEQIYAEADKNPAFDYSYYPAHADVLKQRIQQAGVRLAGLLNEALK